MAHLQFAWLNQTMWLALIYTLYVISRRVMGALPLKLFIMMAKKEDK
jgi:hypothetical protein